MNTFRVLRLLPLLAVPALAGWAADPPKAAPSEGTAPFDPKPMMAKVEARIQKDTYRFAVVGDSKHAKSFPALLDYMNQTIRPDFVLATGDLVVAGGGKSGPADWEKLAQEAHSALRVRPWWPVIGNHEMAGTPPKKDEELDDDAPDTADGLANFKRFFNLDRDYYSFGFRNAVFIALPYPWPKGDSLAWLEQELKKASEAKKKIFVFNHNPFFTVGTKKGKDYPNAETDLTRMFSTYKVCAVFSGHDHIYYRTLRRDVPYVISAGGGATLYALARKAEALPADVYYGVVPGTDKAAKDPATGKTVTPKKRYLYHNGATGVPDRITEQSDQYAVVVDVDGSKVTLTCVTAKGETWDEMILAK